MIVTGIPAQITCDEAGCDAKGFVHLVLMGNGCFGWRPAFKDKWQVGQADNGILVSRCEKHAKVVQPASVIPNAVLGGVH